MNFFVYSDESGVFDRVHNDIYVFGGLILTGKEEKDICARKYLHVESTIRRRYQNKSELKANILSNKDKGKIYRSLNNEYKFAAIIDENKVNENIFDNKKSKQRFLDYVYKLALKNALLEITKKKQIESNDIENIYVFYDEHTTATNGRYELQESLLQEFKEGTFNWNYNTFFPPCFPNLHSVTTKICDSKSTTLIRAADIIANKVYHSSLQDYFFRPSNKNIFIKRFP